MSTATFDKLALRDSVVTTGAMRDELAPIKAEMMLLKWMVGFNLALSVAVVLKLFTH